MKICIAQTKPIKGDIDSNIAAHLKMTDIAVLLSTDLIVFPELSLTGYEPLLSEGLATIATDKSLEVFQKVSDTKGIIICVGLPTRGDLGIHISMAIFQPYQAPLTNSKQYLHSDELPIFYIS